MIRGRLVRQLLPILVVLWLGLTAALAVQQPKQAPQPKPQEVTVYITRTGARYHRATCRHLARSKIPISLKEAKEKGYTAVNPKAETVK